MNDPKSKIALTSPDHSATLARALGANLKAGDVVLMEGDVGAGKTHFARSLIQSLLPQIEDVPSPTFTLVQIYDTVKGEIWHSDLYRLTSPDEAVELGLEDAFSEAICLVEWPDRLAELAPDHALHLSFSVTGDNTRALELRWSDAKWQAKLAGIMA